MNLREATSELHKLAEGMEFNQRLINGTISRNDYLNYLRQQYSIFKEIEKNELPHPSLKRSDKVVADIIGMADLYYEPLPATKKYVDYLSRLDDEKRNCHIYLNYMALLYGGQMMKTKVPGRTFMYDFDDKDECIGSIRKIQKDEWADEVNKGFEFIINIYNELQAISRQDS